MGGTYIALPVWILLILTNHRRIFIGLDRVFISLFTIIGYRCCQPGLYGFYKEIPGKRNRAILVQNQLWHLFLSPDRHFIFLEII